MKTLLTFLTIMILSLSFSYSQNKHSKVITKSRVQVKHKVKTSVKYNTIEFNKITENNNTYGILYMRGNGMGFGLMTDYKDSLCEYIVVDHKCIDVEYSYVFAYFDNKKCVVFKPHAIYNVDNVYQIIQIGREDYENTITDFMEYIKTAKYVKFITIDKCGNHYECKFPVEEFRKNLYKIKQ